MIAAGFVSSEWTAWLMVLVLSMCVLFVCALVAIPWTVAHMRFWGGRTGAKGELDAADLLGRYSGVCLAGVFFFGLYSVHLASSRNPAGWFAVSVFLAPVLWTVPLFLVAWGGLFQIGERAPGWGRGPSPGQIWGPVGSGITAIIVVAVVAGLIAGVGDPSLWPQIRQSPLAAWTSLSFLFLMAFILFASALTGGVVLMVVGCRSFFWERGESVSMGARMIRLGASVSFGGLILLIVLAVVWLITEQLEPIREVMRSSRPLVLFMVIFLIGGVLGLLELFVSILRWRGNAPRASLAAAALLVGTVFFAMAVISLGGSSRVPPPDQNLLLQGPGLPRGPGLPQGPGLPRR